MNNVNNPDPNCKTLQQLEIYSLIYNNNFHQIELGYSLYFCNYI